MCALALLVTAGCEVGWDEQPAAELGLVAECSLAGAGVYSPYVARGSYPVGTPVEVPWRGAESGYPGGMEDFRGYSSLPATVECSFDKDARSHLDVTSGCLDAVLTGDGRYDRGRAFMDAKNQFRMLALAYDGERSLPAKWTDQGTEFRFFHAGQTADDSTPGIKAFVRYRSEDDLYVALWRFDGVVQIKRKWCGRYETLAVDRHFGPPSPRAWHRMRFEAVGDKLSLWLDDELALEASDGTFSWGTAGIRIDSADATYLDDWAVYEP